MIVVAVLCGLVVGAAVTLGVAQARRSWGSGLDRPVRHILLPFTGASISRRALEAAVRLARAEHAVIMPAFLAVVPRHLPLEAPLPAAAGIGMPVLEAIEQRARAKDVLVDSRVGRGRTFRDALERVLESEHFDRVIVSATNSPRNGLNALDLEWLLERVPAEVMILRPAADDTRIVSGERVAGHF
jgi:nucleotide-binding universal stress UspA family protein